MPFVNNNLSYHLQGIYYRQGPRMCPGHKHRFSHLSLTMVFIAQRGQQGLKGVTSHN